MTATFTRAELEAKGYTERNGVLVKTQGPITSTIDEGTRYRSKLEARRVADLDALTRGGLIKGFVYEPMSLVIAHKRRYVPDFLVWELDGSLTLEEVKGRTAGREWERGGTKLHVAARMYPMFRFALVTFENGAFLRREVQR
jgi:hypothetical protein